MMENKFQMCSRKNSVVTNLSKDCKAGFCPLKHSVAQPVLERIRLCFNACGAGKLFFFFPFTFTKEDFQEEFQEKAFKNVISICSRNWRACEL